MKKISAVLPIALILAAASLPSGFAFDFADPSRLAAVEARISELKENIKLAQEVAPEVQGILVIALDKGGENTLSIENARAIVGKRLEREQAELAEAREQLDEIAERKASAGRGSQRALSGEENLAGMRIRLAEDCIKDAQADLAVIADLQAGDNESSTQGLKERKLKLLREELRYVKVQRALIRSGGN